MQKVFDTIIVGAGSVGVPLALNLARAGQKVCVLDRLASPGQGSNKTAIGGIRGTHGDPAKISVGLRAREVFATWEEKEGDDIEWERGGYIFPFWRDVEGDALKKLPPMQQKFGLKSSIINAEETMEVCPGINSEGLLGALYTPNDGHACPLRSLVAFANKAVESGATFEYRTSVEDLIVEGDKVTGVKTDKGDFHAKTVVDAAGSWSPELVSSVYSERLPIHPDSHEGGITEAVSAIHPALIVDMRPGELSKNCYFYQNKRGQFVFCITPDPPILGTDLEETSVFLPQIAKRLIEIIPGLANIRVRRVWRGLYPMTPDGSPLLGYSNTVENLFHATGMCGQGYMLGPGIADVITNLFTATPTEEDKIVLDAWDPTRDFSVGSVEALK